MVWGRVDILICQEPSTVGAWVGPPRDYGDTGLELITAGWLCDYCYSKLCT